MERTTLDARKISSNRTAFTIPNVTSMSIRNEGSSEVTVTVNNVDVQLAAYDDGNKYTDVFVIDADGTMSDIELEVEFEGGRGKIVAWFRQYVEPNPCKQR